MTSKKSIGLYLITLQCNPVLPVSSMQHCCVNTKQLALMRQHPRIGANAPRLVSAPTPRLPCTTQANWHREGAMPAQGREWAGGRCYWVGYGWAGLAWEEKGWGLRFRLMAESPGCVASIPAVESTSYVLAGTDPRNP